MRDRLRTLISPVRRLGGRALRKAGLRGSARVEHFDVELAAQERARILASEQRAWRDLAEQVPPRTLPQTSLDGDSDDDEALLRRSGLVHGAWYQEHYRLGDIDAVEHYLRQGADAGYNPNPLFDTRWYEQIHAEQLRPSQNPLVHYLREGAATGCDPGPFVELGELRSRLPFSQDEPLSVLFHLIEHGDTAGVQAALLEGRDPRLALDDSELRLLHLLQRQFESADDFVLYRILGNDLPPRHRTGQSEHNLRFMLENEPQLGACEKRFVVNRIIDQEVEVRLMELLETYGAHVLHLPFEAERYRECGWRVADFQEPGMLYGVAFERLSREVRARAVDHVYHDKNRYVMNNNGARNAALHDGRERARWVLPFDGNCFFTASGWAELRDAVIANAHRRYILVPMARINDNEQLLEPHFHPDPREEPQIAFRKDAQETFDEDQRYGRRPKVSLLRRLAVPGPWDGWRNESWEPDAPGPSPDAGQYHEAGWVARLESGQPKLETDDRGRMLSRMEAIRRRLVSVDEMVLRERFDPAALHARSETALAAQRATGRWADHTIEELLATLRVEPAHKKEPSVRVFRSGSAAIVTHGLRGWLRTSDADLVLARDLTERWFVSSSRVSPTPSRRDPWLLRDLDQVLDVVRLLDRAELMSQASMTGVRSWVADHSRWLTSSRQGKSARRSLGRAGTWYEVQLAACHAFLDDAPALLEDFQRVAVRRHDQFDLLMRAPNHRRGSATVLRPSNLQGWLRLTAVANRLGIAIEEPGSRSEQGLHDRLRAALVGSQGSTRAVLAFQLLAAGVPGVDVPAEVPTTAQLPGLPSLWWAGSTHPNDQTD